MATLVGRQLKKRFAVPYACYKLLSKKHNFITESGWLESIRSSKPCDQHGAPVPWMNYGVVEFLQERLTSSMRVFEYGSGYSTCFFAKLAREVVAVEHDEAWMHRVEKMRPSNARLVHCHLADEDRYCRTIAQHAPPFDVVIVDGRHRVQCVREAVAHLSGGGVILLDDSDRDRYAAAFEIMKEAGFRHLTLSGIKPGNPCRNQTTIFYRNDNLFGI